MRLEFVLICGLVGLVRGCSDDNLPDFTWSSCPDNINGCDACIKVDFKDGQAVDYLCLTYNGNKNYCNFLGQLYGEGRTIAVTGGCPYSGSKLEVILPIIKKMWTMIKIFAFYFQISMSSRRCPFGLFKVEDGVTSRIKGDFGGGLVDDIAYPDEDDDAPFDAMHAGGDKGNSLTIASSSLVLVLGCLFVRI